LELKRKLGTFFTIVGIATLALFFTSDFARAPSLGLLFWGLIVTLLGIYLLKGTRPPQEESQRFRTVRKIFSKVDKKSEGDN